MAVISFISPLLCLFFINTLVVKLTNRRFGDSFPITIIALPLILLTSHYIFRNLIYGVYLIYAIVIGSIVLFIINIKDKDYREKVFSNGFIVYLFIYLFIFIVTRGMYFYTWDEFSFWGPTINQLVATNKMYTGIPHAGYPPFAQLFEYVMVKFGLYFEEYNIKFALHLLNFTIFCVPVSERFGDEDSKKISALKGIVLFLITFFLAMGIDAYKSFRTIYIDVTVSMFFAYLIYLLIYKENKYMIALSVFAFMMLKDIAILFTSFVLLYAFISFIYEIVCEKEKKEIAIKYVKLALWIMIPMIVSYLLWHIYKVSANLLDDQFAISKFNVSSFFEIFRGSLEGERLEGYNNYMKAIFTTNLSRSGISFTYFVSFIVIELILGAFTIASKAEHKVALFVKQTIFIAVSYVVYMLFMMNMYVNIFEGTERVGTASFARYMSSLVLGIYLITLVYIYKFSNAKWILFIIYFIMSIVLGSSYISMRLDSRINQSLFVDPLQNERRAYQRLNNTLNQGDRCLVVIDYDFYTDLVKGYYNKVGDSVVLYDVKNLEDENNVKKMLDDIKNYKCLYIVDNNNQVLVPFVSTLNDYVTKYPEYKYDFSSLPANEVINIR